MFPWPSVRVCSGMAWARNLEPLFSPGPGCSAWDRKKVKSSSEFARAQGFITSRWRLSLPLRSEAGFRPSNPKKTAGWIDADASIQYALQQAKDLGAELILDNPVLGWECRENQLKVKTERENLIATKLIITAGAWANQVLRDLGLPLTVKRKVLAWFDPLQPEQFEEEKIPIFAFAPNLFYGFPNIGGRGVKVGEHLGGNLVHDLNLPVMPPSSEDLDSLVETASEVVPTLIGPPPGRDVRLLRTMTCLYTLTPDEHFIIDRHPRHQNVFFAAGFSGHGFKFAPVIAEALADLALDGKTTLPIDFLRLKGRFEKSGN